jgi:hypothetical protein
MYWTKAMTGVMRIVGVMLLGALLWDVETVRAEGCPPNSEPYVVERQGDVEVVRCRCKEGYAKHEGRCEPAEPMFRARAQETQQEVAAHRITDCEAMARLFDELGRDVSWDLDALVQTSARVLAGRVGYRDVTLVEPAPEGVVRFGERGFDGKYRDREPGNQVRHFVGYFATGAKVSGPLLTELITEWRDGQEPGDYQLGVFAANLGRQMRENPQLVRGLGGAIRKTICR